MIIHTDAEWAIGKEGGLLFHVPEDLEYFKEVTRGDICLMGRKTFDSLPFENGLPDRENWVLSKTPRKYPKTPNNVLWWVTTQTIRLCSKMSEAVDKTTWVIGGAAIYQEFLPEVTEVHHVETYEVVEDADTFFDMDFLMDGSWVLKERRWLVEDQTELCIYIKK